MPMFTEAAPAPAPGGAPCQVLMVCGIMHVRAIVWVVVMASTMVGACKHLAGTSETEPGPDVVAVFDGQHLTLAEFEEQFLKTSAGLESATGDSMAAYRDFLDRYVNLRIKLLAAREAGYYELEDLLQELDSYRVSFGRPYLVDKEVMEPILRDMYEKRKEVVEVSHILARLDPNPLPADTLAAYERLSTVRDSVLAGADFGDLAARHSEDPSARMPSVVQGYRGYLGRFSAGRMIKPFEDMAYETPVGEVSPIVRTQYGYHLLKVHSKVPSRPDVRISHIMTRVQGLTGADTLAALEKIRAAGERISAGESFEAVALDVSEDPNSNTRGGDVGIFRFDAFDLDSVFYHTAFGLESVGDVSGVVESQFGFHVLKLTERMEPGTFEEDYEDLENMAAHLPRVREAEGQLAGKARAEFAATVDTTALLELVAGQRPDSVRAILTDLAGDDLAASRLVGGLGDSLITVGRLASFVNDPSKRLRNENSAALQVLSYVDALLDELAVSYAARNLEMTDPEFADIIQEFRDGLVLFRFMEDSVWTAADQDSAGLLAHYEANRDSYWFGDRKRIVQIFSRNDSLLSDAVARIDSGLTWTELAAFLAEDSLHQVTLDSILVEGTTSSIYDRALDLEPGSRTEFLPYRGGRVALYLDGTEPARARTFEEARARVVNEHQQTLEAEVVARLRNRYRVTTFPERLVEAFRTAPAQ